MGELKDFDVQEEGKFFGFFRKQTSKIENLKNKYDKAQANVEKITDSLQQHQVRLMKDSAMLDKMYEQNLNYFKEFTMYILAGKKKLEETRNGKLAEMKNKAALSGLPEDAQAARDLDEKCSRFEKKLLPASESLPYVQQTTLSHIFLNQKQPKMFSRCP